MRTITNIPVSLCEYALINRKVNQLKLYIYLKLSCKGYIEYNQTSIHKWSKEIGVHAKTVKSSFEWLVKNRWITVNSKRQALNIISYNRLKSRLQMKGITGVLIELSTCKDYEYFRALCCAIVVTYYLRRKRYFDRRSERIFGGSITNRNKINSFYPMPNIYLAKCIKISISTACRIKQEAESAGYIETKGDYCYLVMSNGNKISSNHFDIMRSESLKEGNPDFLRRGRKYIKKVCSDLIKSHITCKRKGY